MFGDSKKSKESLLAPSGGHDVGLLESKPVVEYRNGSGALIGTGETIRPSFGNPYTEFRDFEGELICEYRRQGMMDQDTVFVFPDGREELVSTGNFQTEAELIDSFVKPLMKEVYAQAYGGRITVDGVRGGAQQGWSAWKWFKELFILITVMWWVIGVAVGLLFGFVGAYFGFNFETSMTVGVIVGLLLWCWMVYDKIKNKTIDNY